MGPRPCADGNRFNGLGDFFHHPGRHAFQHHTNHPCLVKRQGVFDEGLGLLPGPSLDLEAAEGRGALWREPDMAHNRDSRAFQSADMLDKILPAFNFSGMFCSYDKQRPCDCSDEIKTGIGNPDPPCLQ
jgi:hypothetical protein